MATDGKDQDKDKKIPPPNNNGESKGSTSTDKGDDQQSKDDQRKKEIQKYIDQKKKNKEEEVKLNTLKSELDEINDYIEAYNKTAQESERISVLKPGKLTAEDIQKALDSLSPQDKDKLNEWREWGQYGDGYEMSQHNNNVIPSNYNNNDETLIQEDERLAGIEVDKRDHSFLDFYIPQYGVQDYINERALWQKGTNNFLGEPGWFYFKVFFKFDDFKGLFGGILNNKLAKISAIRYLAGIRNYYGLAKIQDRMLSLARFTYTLAYICQESPWFFTGINNANILNQLDIEELTKEKSIDLICNNEAIDMRLSTLLDMYRYACYDEIYFKEIIPENLRKFDMSIIIMNVPIKYLHTGIILGSKDASISHFTQKKNIVKAIDKINKITSFIQGYTDTSTFDYKTLNGIDNQPLNRLSFQMYTLKNCEIDKSSFSNYIPSSLTNTEFFKIGGNAIKIKFDRCYKHTFNEWQQMMYGTDGIYYDQEDNYLNTKNLTALIDRSKYSDINLIHSANDQKKRIRGIQNSIYNSFFNKDVPAYKALIDFSEAIIKDSMINISNEFYLGNIEDSYDRNRWSSVWDATKKNIEQYLGLHDTFDNSVKKLGNNIAKGIKKGLQQPTKWFK